MIVLNDEWIELPIFVFEVKTLRLFHYCNSRYLVISLFPKLRTYLFLIDAECCLLSWSCTQGRLFDFPLSLVGA